MKPLLLHGPAINSSRRKLQELKKKFNPDNIVVFDSEVNSGQVIASLMTVPMFFEDRLVIWENPSEVFELPARNATHSVAGGPTTFVLWFDHEIDTKKWPGFEVLFFPEAKEISIFPFLDFLAAKDQKAFLELDKLNQAGFDIHYALTMVFYLLRNLLVTPKNAPDFVKKKLERQRIKFSTEDIKSLYRDLLEIDFKLKSGLLEKPQAEFLSINKFMN